MIPYCLLPSPLCLLPLCVLSVSVAKNRLRAEDDFDAVVLLVSEDLVAVRGVGEG